MSKLDGGFQHISAEICRLGAHTESQSAEIDCIGAVIQRCVQSFHISDRSKYLSLDSLRHVDRPAFIRLAWCSS